LRQTTKFVALLSTALLSATALAGCAGSSDGSEASKDSLAVATSTPLRTFDPTQMDCGAGRLYCQAAYDTLLHQNATGDPEPGMATSFTYDKTRTRLTLQLREGIAFSDGSAFDAHTAKASLDWFMKAGGPSSIMASALKSVSVEGADRLLIELKEPDPALLLNLSSNLGMMASAAALRSPEIASQPVGSGPYLYNASKSQSGTTVFDRNEEYWDKQAYPFDHLKLVQLADPNTILNALKVGQIDAAGVIPSQLGPVKAAGMSVMESAGNWNGLVLADRAGSVQPALGKVEVRRAINLALDRDLFTQELVPDGSTWSDQIFAPGGPAYDEDLNDRYQRDVATAKQLMADAGYSGGFSVSMPDLSQFVGSPALNTAIDQQLGAINIEVTWEKVPVMELLSSMQGGKFPMFFMALGTKSPWQDLQLSVLPDATFNPFHSSAPELDALLADAQTAGLGAAQSEAFKAVNTWLVDNAWFAPIFAGSAGVAFAPGITVEQQAQGVDLVRFQRAGK